MELAYLGILALLLLLGLPPELNQNDPSRGSVGLALALLGVQVVLVTYFASACAAQEIAVEGERPAVDLAFGPFSRRTIVAGKSLATLATIVYWELLALPLLILAMEIRRLPLGALGEVCALVTLQAWAVAQIGLLCGIVFEAEFTRTLAHWTALLAIFVATLALPDALRWANPVVAAAQAAAGAMPVLGAACYAALGLGAGGLAYAALRRFGTP
jgi:ABC-type transport system involved in multi-copper enzyme maturation permease subunit